jgi:hypothetical protein
MLSRSNGYFVVIKCQGLPPAWTWEIQSRSKPPGIRFYGADFRSELIAKLAGEKALSELLDRIADAESNL